MNDWNTIKTALATAGHETLAELLEGRAADAGVDPVLILAASVASVVHCEPGELAELVDAYKAFVDAADGAISLSPDLAELQDWTADADPAMRKIERQQ